MGHVIAIDGPAGAGKSTIARRLAERLGYTFIDSGAMYRAVALWALRQNMGLDDAHRLEQLALAPEIELLPQRRVRLNGEDVSEAIRVPEVSAAASRVAAIRRGSCRHWYSNRSTWRIRGNVVMEGRDIGTVVFPDARVKIFLDADPRERVRRRAGEQPEVPREELAAQIARARRARSPSRGIAADSGAGCGLSRFDRHERRRGGGGDPEARPRPDFEWKGTPLAGVLKRPGHYTEYLDRLLVMKFGGTSVGSAERMKVACDLIAAEAARRPVVAVVSAMSKITDLLLDTTRHAEAGDQAGIDYNLHQLELRHYGAAGSLLGADSPSTAEARRKPPSGSARSYPNSAVS